MVFLAALALFLLVLPLARFLLVRVRKSIPTPHEPAWTSLDTFEDWTHRVVVAALAVVVITGWMLPDDHHRPQAGDNCGPGHHWRMIGNGELQDLSRESD